MACLLSLWSLLALAQLTGASPAGPEITQPAVLPRQYDLSDCVECGNVTFTGNAYLYQDYPEKLRCQCQASFSSWLSTCEIQGIVTADVQDQWIGTAKSPCCYSCTIAASEIELFYWPSSATTITAAPYVSNGFTYVSPSVYLGFSSLSAYDYCGAIGSVVVNTTLAFNPSELSTLINELTSTIGTYYGETSTSTFITIVGTAQLNYADLQQNTSVIKGYTYSPSPEHPSKASGDSVDLCHPTFVLPDRIKTLQPCWSSCEAQLVRGLYDPAVAISTAPPLNTSSTTTTSTTTTSTSSKPTTTTSSTRTTSTSSKPTTTTSSKPTTTTSSTSTSTSLSSSTSSVSSSSSSTSSLSSSSSTLSSTSSTSISSTSSSSTSSFTSSTSIPSTSSSSSSGSSESGSVSPTQVTVPILAVGSLTFTENSQSKFVHGDVTITRGGSPVTVDGVTISIPTTGSVAVEDGQTDMLEMVTETQSSPQTTNLIIPMVSSSMLLISSHNSTAGMPWFRLPLHALYGLAAVHGFLLAL